MPICPACAKEQSVEGTVAVAGNDDGMTTQFYPKGLKFWTLRRSVTLQDGQRFHACTACGHVWAQVDPKQLRDLLAHSRK